MKKEDFLKICRSKASKELSSEEETFLGGIGEAIEKAFESNTVERSKQIEAITSKLGQFDGDLTISTIIRNLSETVSNLEAKTKRGLSESDKFNLKKALEAKADDIKRARSGGQPWSIEFHAKRAASALMTNATVLTGAAAYNTDNVFSDPEVTVIQYPKNFILDAINNRTVAKVPAYLRWKEEITAGTGAITNVSEGAEKTLSDYKFDWNDATRKKYAGRIEFTEEVEIDHEQLMIDIINMFEQKVLRAWQDGVLADILAWCPSYTSSSLDDTIVNPTVYSVIGALKLQAQSENYEPDVLFINPGDAAEAIYLQDNNGNQQFIPETLQFGGLKAFITNKITVGTIMVGVSSVVNEQHGSYIVRRGVTGTQFYENESTIVGEIFSILKLPTESKKGWVKGDIATVKAALLKPSGN